MFSKRSDAVFPKGSASIEKNDSPITQTPEKPALEIPVDIKFYNKKVKLGSHSISMFTFLQMGCICGCVGCVACILWFKCYTHSSQLTSNVLIAGACLFAGLAIGIVIRKGFVERQIGESQVVQHAKEDSVDINKERSNSTIDIIKTSLNQDIENVHQIALDKQRDISTVYRQKYKEFKQYSSTSRDSSPLKQKYTLELCTQEAVMSTLFYSPMAHAELVNHPPVAQEQEIIFSVGEYAFREISKMQNQDALNEQQLIHLCESSDSSKEESVTLNALVNVFYSKNYVQLSHPQDRRPLTCLNSDLLHDTAEFYKRLYLLQEHPEYWKVMAQPEQKHFLSLLKDRVIQDRLFIQRALCGHYEVGILSVLQELLKQDPNDSLVSSTLNQCCWYGFSAISTPQHSQQVQPNFFSILFSDPQTSLHATTTACQLLIQYPGLIPVYGQYLQECDASQQKRPTFSCSEQFILQHCFPEFNVLHMQLQQLAEPQLAHPNGQPQPMLSVDQKCNGMQEIMKDIKNYWQILKEGKAQGKDQNEGGLDDDDLQVKALDALQECMTHLLKHLDQGYGLLLLYSGQASGLLDTLEIGEFLKWIMQQYPQEILSNKEGQLMQDAQAAYSQYCMTAWVVQSPEHQQDVLVFNDGCLYTLLGGYPLFPRLKAQCIENLQENCPPRMEGVLKNVFSRVDHRGETLRTLVEKSPDFQGPEEWKKKIRTGYLLT